MRFIFAALWAAVLLATGAAWGQERPKAGPFQIMKTSEIQPGMKGTAWTVFQGKDPEAVPVEIIGLWKNAWGPKQDIILAKLGGQVARTNVAGGMSGSPVYIDGKLIGAVALRISVFSPDAIAGITPIESMLEIRDLDQSRPSDSRAPQQPWRQASLELPEQFTPSRLMDQRPQMVPIETPLALAGFHESTLRAFRPYFEQMGVTAVQGGAAGSIDGSKPAAGWENALQPGDAIAGVLVSGDLSITGLGTVTMNDGKRVMGFGHSFFNLGPVNMPMSKGEVLMVLSSQFQPNKFANATEIVGALKQDRHSGILGELGAIAPTIPVSLTVRARPFPNSPAVERKLKYNVFVHPRWTPFLMMLTAFNSLQDLNDGMPDDATYTMSGNVKVAGAGVLDLKTMVTSGEAPMPPAMQAAGWWAEKFNRLFQNPDASPKIESVEVVIDVEPQKRLATIESAWLDSDEVSAGGTLSGKVALRQWRGERILRDFKVSVPPYLPKGDHRLMISDAETLNRAPMMAALSQRTLDLAQTVTVLNRERTNNKAYVSVLESRPTVYLEDQTLSALPPSVLNVLQAGPGTRPPASMSETARMEQALPLDVVVNGVTTLRFTVK